MSTQLSSVLQELLIERRKSAFKAGTPISTYVFLTPSSTPVDGDNFRRRIFRKVLPKAGLGDHHPHDMRHTFASLLIQNGESLKYVQEQMGHSSIQVTADIYGHLIPGSNKAAVDRLDAPIRIPAASEVRNTDQKIAVSD